MLGDVLNDFFKKIIKYMCESVDIFWICTICRIINEKVSGDSACAHKTWGCIVHMLVYSGMPVARERSMA